MKLIKTIIITCFLVLLMGCDPIYSIYFVNKSNRIVYADINSVAVLPTYTYHPDPSFPINEQDTSVLWEGIGNILTVFDAGEKYVDTMFVFVVDYDTIIKYSWDTVIKYNMVLQRYDLSLADLEGMNVRDCYSILYFPPTESMRHIHMWPPYGTYNTNKLSKKE